MGEFVLMAEWSESTLWRERNSPGVRWSVSRRARQLWRKPCEAERRCVFLQNGCLSPAGVPSVSSHTHTDPAWNPKWWRLRFLRLSWSQQPLRVSMLSRDQMTHYIPTVYSMGWYFLTNSTPIFCLWSLIGAFFSFNLKVNWYPQLSKSS